MLRGVIDPGNVRLQEFCRDWRVKELAIFGSALRDDFRPESDLDLLVTFEDGASWDLLDLLHMQDEASTLLGRPVDLVSKRGVEEGANEIIRSEVLGTAE